MAGFGVNRNVVAGITTLAKTPLRSFEETTLALDRV